MIARAARTAPLRLHTRASSTLAHESSARGAGPAVNSVHIPDFQPTPSLAHPVSNESQPVAQAHWEPEWDDATVRAATSDHVMATWTPGKSLESALHVARAEGVYLYDREDRQYFDFTSQAVCANLGHTVPETIQAAVHEQLKTAAYVYSDLAVVEHRARLASLLADIAPGDIDAFMFPSSGAEANEAAIRMARRYTGRTKVISLFRSYHGGTASSLNATGDFRRWLVDANNGSPGHLKAWSASPNLFSMGATEEEAGAMALAMLEEQILLEGPDTIAAFLMEAVIGSGGVFIHPENYVQGVRALCDKYGIVMIVDEVMTGFGRTGKMWGVQNYDGVVPDIITSAKGLTGSVIPMSMVGVNRKLKEHFETTTSGWGSTFQAHPVALRCAYETVKYIVANDVVGHVKRMEAVLLEEIQRLVDEHPSVQQGRGLGLFGCIDTQGPDGHLTQNVAGPWTADAQAFKAAYARHGLFGLLRMPHVHVAPPLVTTEAELRDGFQRLSRALDESLDQHFK